MSIQDVAVGGTVSVATDSGMIVVYDLALLKDRVKDPKRWWYTRPFATDERQDGRYAIWPLGGKEGVTYRVRLGSGLDEVERPYDRGCAGAAPLRVVGPDGVFLGPAERIPGDGFGDRLSQIPDKGGLVPLGPGRYSLVAHVLDWRPEARFWTEDNEPTADAPPDVVIVLTALEGDAPLPAAEPEVTPLLSLLPRKEIKGSERVVHATRPRNAVVLLDEKPGRKPRVPGAPVDRDPREPAAPVTDRDPEARRSPMRAGTIRADGRPGEVRVGAQVRHPRYGIGTVTFLRDGFPKARVTFHDGEQKVDKDELKAID
jgi:hypothetical protein